MAKIVNKPDSRNGHELAQLNSSRTGDGGVTIVVSPTNGGHSLSMGSPGEERAAWSGKLQFFLSIIGYSVGLGNIWRFPYLCQQNGGGAFLIPFVIMLILEGIPLFLIEIGIGQKMRLGALGVWNTVHPWLGGIGIASCIVTFFVALYYNIIITWCFYYFFNSFQSPLPWSECPVVNNTVVYECEVSSETAYFWYRTTLDVAPNIEDHGGLKWWIVLCLILSWITVFFIVMKGIQSSGKVVYFTSMFPYIVLTIFFVRGITLKGSGAGLMHMYTPKVEKLSDPTVWMDAATQVFYSFGLAFGSLIAFGSYNTPKNNCVRDVILVSICNAATAIYASVVVFAILGFKAMLNYDRCIDGNKIKLVSHQIIPSVNISESEYDLILREKVTNHTMYDLEECSLEKELDQAAEGTGLAFVVFTQAIVELPGAPFWSVIFFMMLLSLGIGSQIGILEGMLCTIFDIEIFKRIKKQYLTGFVCLICCIVGLLFCTGAGEYWLKLFDSFAGTIGLVFLALLETFAVMYVYGHAKFTQDIEDMTGYRPGWYWQITWRFIGPIIMTAILVSSIVYRIVNKPTFSAWDSKTGETFPAEYPTWVLIIAIMMILAGTLPIPLVFLLRRFQCLKLDVDIHQGSIRRIDTTVSTKEMMGDMDVSRKILLHLPFFYFFFVKYYGA
ncbi:sodium- and chloride-dependent transporter, putative [Pediculus humanus corporis]|uniref:Transporter n=1 Tax=Pediculus humanus subsp. corporis TaxID=121224 RepID=E0VXR3_PEDHC|nr:sodium- and chloride-dependent transporter, putative [Pediculus humanus corporis]EEB18169.1 sodium- and chloride-dependent transporter, putative [Pediculus humanus corporis]